MWNPSEHNDQDNLRWCWLRAVEWGRWPVFISQAFAPVALLFINWPTLITTVVMSNFLWAFFVRYKFVSVYFASLGAWLVKLKWISSPVMGYYFYLHHQLFPAAIALFWPILIFIIGAVPTAQIGIIQNMFMKELGYDHSDATANGGKQM